MADATLILNAGSSSLKFSVFLDEDRPQTLLSGQIEELLTRPHFEVRDAAGNVVGAKEWETGTNLGTTVRLNSFSRGAAARRWPGTALLRQATVLCMAA